MSNNGNTYGVTATSVLTEIRKNRRLVTFWTDKGMPNVAADHAANVRDLRVLLLNVRFPNNTLPVTYADDFTPVVVVTPDVVSDEDVNAFIGAIADHVESVTGETVNA